MPLKIIRKYKTDDLEAAFNQFESNAEIEILNVQYFGDDINDPCFGVMIYYKSRRLKNIEGDWVK